MLTLRKSYFVFCAAFLTLPVQAELYKGADLFDIQAYEEKHLSREETEAKNRQELTNLNSTVITRVVNTSKGPRYNGTSKEWVTRIVNSIDRHPVVSNYQYNKYNRAGHEIGFCFGRAAYTHIALLKLGVNKDAIRKAFIVGRMDAGGIEWIFHVTTLVKDYATNTWWAVDDYPGRILTADQWYEYMNSQAARGAKLRLFITDPKRFAPSIGDYDRLTLGLDLSKEEDFYQHYFKDLMKWFRSKKDRDFLP